MFPTDHATEVGGVPHRSQGLIAGLLGCPCSFVLARPLIQCLQSGMARRWMTRTAVRRSHASGFLIVGGVCFCPSTGGIPDSAPRNAPPHSWGQAFSGGMVGPHLPGAGAHPAACRESSLAAAEPKKQWFTLLIRC